MGVVYKLTPEIINHILEVKKKDPAVSCRGLTAMLKERFQVDVSKSSINSVFKTAGLSFPVGRRRKQRKGEVGGKGFGCLLLKACDAMAGGSAMLVELAKSSLPVPSHVAEGYLDQLLYAPHCNCAEAFPRKADSALGNGSVTLASFAEVRLSSTEITSFTSKVAAEARFVKLTLPSSKELYLDPLYHTVWSSNHIPRSFSCPSHKAELDITSHMFNKDPFSFLMVPGYDAPTKEFFEFVSSLTSDAEKTIKITFGTLQGEEQPYSAFSGKDKIHFVIGLWPWQFGQNSSITMSNQYKLFYFEPLKQDFYVCETSVELFQPELNAKIVLRGCALKNSLEDQVRVYILSSQPESEASMEEIAGRYLRRWFPLEGSFREFSKQMETMALASQNSADSDGKYDWQLLENATLQEVCSQYAKFLQWYFAKRIVQLQGTGMKLSDIQGFCTEVAGTVKRRPTGVYVRLAPHPQYGFREQLDAACRTLNQRMVSFGHEKTVWFSL